MIKKSFNVILILLLLVILISCSNNNELINDEEEIDLTNLPYYRYLNDNNPVITIKVKNYGTMEAQLFSSNVENTTNNFINYIQNKKFNNSSFHRVIKDFMIQGGIVNNPNQPINGDFISNGINNQIKHDRGVLSMARTSAPNSATSQFFIIHKKSPHLDGAYAAFGGLISGFSVLDKIANAETNSNDSPKTEVEIESITIKLNGYITKEVIYTK